jgi:acetyl-CoA carboxylase carboxyltransferase component
VAADALRLAELARQARQARHPLAVSLAASGTAISDGLAAVTGFGRAGRELVACSGVVPTLAVVDGPVLAGPALLLGLFDFVILTKRALCFLSGPRMVERFTGVVVDPARLGGAGTHARLSGLAALVVDDLSAAEMVAAELLSFLPLSCDDLPAQAECTDPLDRQTPRLTQLLPASATGSYDVRDVVAELVDHRGFLEVRPSWASQVVIGFARINGHPLGVVANQPCSMAGTLDIAASQKAARFVTLCDSFNLPILTLVDTPGFMPGKDLEWKGMIRHGAELAFAYAEATVPRLSLVLRKAYGGAYIVMDSKGMGGDFCLAWPTAEVAVMGAQGAVSILNRNCDDAAKKEAELRYAEAFLNPWVAAELGFLDEVIPPELSRSVIGRVLDVLVAKAEELPFRRHPNGPL